MQHAEQHYTLSSAMPCAQQHLCSATSRFRQAAQLAAMPTNSIRLLLLSEIGIHFFQVINTVFVSSQSITPFFFLSWVSNMSKCKAVSGSHQDSSDDEDGLGTNPVQPRRTPYVPPHLMAASRLGHGKFQLLGTPGSLPGVSNPPSRHISISSSSSCPTPAPKSVQSPCNTPEIQIGKC